VPDCTIHADVHGDRPKIVVTGQLDAYHGERLHAVLASHIDAGSLDLLVDAGSVTFLDSGALRALLDAQRAAQDRGGSLTLVAVSEEVRQVLGLADLLGEFGLVDG
jgi:anti-sigma B factor antagonist